MEAGSTLPASRTAALAGGVAVGLSLAVAEVVALALPGGRSVFVAVADRVIALTPGSVVAFAIATFGAANRVVLLTVLLAVAAGAGGVVGILASRRSWIGPAGLAAFALLGAASGSADPLVPLHSALMGPLAGVVAGAVALRRLLTLAPRVPAKASVTAGASDDDPASPALAERRARRAFLVWTVSTAGVAALVAGGGRLLQDRAVTADARHATRLPSPARPLSPPPPGASLDVPGIAPLITPNDRFYRIDTAFTVPRIDPATHTVRVTGMVDRPFTLSYGDLLALADTEADVTLCCVSNEVGGDLIGNARWLGVPLDRVLDRADVHDDATQVVGRSVDGWTGGFPVEAAYDGRAALVAVGMNGEPLPAAHGFPVRLVVAGLYGYVSDTKWLEEIELTTFDAFDAYWIPRGWAREGPIKTQSRIDVPHRGRPVAAGAVTVAGVAWAGERGITAVEVSVDDGPWRPTELAAELARTSWRQWRYHWDAEPGDHHLRVRATDGDGRTQTETVTPPRPDGATGHHRVRLSIT